MSSPRDFEWAREFGDGLAPVRRNYAWGAIDMKGNLVVPFEYQETWASHGGPMLVKRNDRWGFVEATGRVVVEPVYGFAYGFSCGCAPIRENLLNVYRFIGTDGSALFDAAYDEAYSFVLDRAPVRRADEKAWIDRSGNAIFRWRENPQLRNR